MKTVRRAQSWKEFWETIALSSDPVAAIDLWGIQYSRYWETCRKLTHLLDLGPSDVVLNVGCGTGLFDRFAASSVGRWIAIDFAWNMVQSAQAKNNHNAKVYVMQANAQQLPFANGTFDKAIAYSVTHGMSLNEVGLMMREMARVTKLSGLLLIGDIPERLPEQNLWSRISFAYCSEGPQGVVWRLLLRATAPLRLLLRGAKRSYLIKTQRLVPIRKPAYIAFFRRQDLIKLAKSVGLEAEVVDKERDAGYYDGRFSLLLKKDSGCGSQHAAADYCKEQPWAEPSSLARESADWLRPMSW